MITREKNNDVVRIGYGNINGFLAVMINNPKVSALKKWMQKYDVDGFFGAEGTKKKCKLEENAHGWSAA